MSISGLPPGITLDDPRPIAAAAPYTFELPFEAEIAALGPGDGVKAIFRQSDGDTHYDGERMWVRVERIEDGIVYGTLDNEPHDMPLIELGMPVAVPLTHVISCSFAKGKARPELPARRTYWERCLVDDCVLAARSHVDYLYRETPDMDQEGDEYPDSGWRIRGAQAAVEDDEANERAVQYVALGAVLNKDDRWLHLIDEKPGVAFHWDPDANDYVRYDRPDLLASDQDDEQ